MRILLVNSYYEPTLGGGTEVLLTILAKGLVSRGHEVCVIATGSHPGVERCELDGVQVVRLKMRNIYWPLTGKSQPKWKRAIWHAIDIYNPWAARDVLRVAQEFKPDVVSVHNLQGLSSAVWPALARLGVPMTNMMHDYQFACPNIAMFKNGQACKRQCIECKMYRLPYRKLSSCLTAVTASSQAVLDIYDNLGYFRQVPHKRIIRNARHLVAMPNSAPSAVPLREPGVLTYGFIGALSPIKGIEPLLEAFAEFARHAPQRVRLLVAGSGGADFESMLKRKYESDSIRFLGRVNPSQFYPSLDISVVPSLCHDTFPFVTYEALGLGVPVIGAMRGGIPEIIRDGVTGLLFDPDEPGALLNAIRTMAEHPELREQMAAKAPASVQHLLDEDRFVHEHEAFMAQLAAGHKDTLASSASSVSTASS